MVFILEIVVRVAGTYILVNLINLYALPIAALLGSITTLLILSFILIKRSGISFIEIVLSFNLYELVIFILAIFLGYFVIYPSIHSSMHQFIHSFIGVVNKKVMEVFLQHETTCFSSFQW